MDSNVVPMEAGLPRFSNYTPNKNGIRTLGEAISELNREIEVRKKIYDRWTAEGKIDRYDAHDRMERIMSALAILIRVSHMVTGDYHSITAKAMTEWVIDQTSNSVLDRAATS